MLSTLIGVGLSITLGLLVALVHTYRNVYSKNFIITLVALPVLVQLVIMLVNGNLGTGVAVMGAFSLIRFRSVAGGAREITSVFWSMAIGLATGTGAYMEAAIFSAITALLIITLNTLRFGEQNKVAERTLKITIAEDLDFPGIFDEILNKFTYQFDNESVKTTNMGSLYELRYNIKLKNIEDEKKLIDEIRVRNGNLPVSLGRLAQNSEVL